MENGKLGLEELLTLIKALQDDDTRNLLKQVASKQLSTTSPSTWDPTTIDARSTLNSEVPKKSICRTRSAPGSEELALALAPQLALRQAEVTQALLGAHRGLSRTSSDPVPSARQNFLITSAASSDTKSVDGKAGDPGRYKTELCRPFEEHGVCKYGNKCQFAHGKQELRTLIRHPKYKTDLCKTYHTTGLCPYGSRCHFIHDDNDDVMAAKQNVRLIEEHKIRMLQQQILERQTYQQMKQKDILLNSLSHLSIPTPQPTIFDNLLGATAHLSYDSTGSLSTASPPSSITESPATSPAMQMFGYEEPTTISRGMATDGLNVQPVKPNDCRDEFSSDLSRALFGDMKSHSLQGVPGALNNHEERYDDVLAVAKVLAALKTNGNSSMFGNGLQQYSMPYSFGLTF